MVRARTTLIGLAIFAGLASIAGMASPDGMASARADSPAEPLVVDTVSGPHRFKVEVMRTEPERERGLMFRKSMPRDHGMLFEYTNEQSVT